MVIMWKLYYLSFSYFCFLSTLSFEKFLVLAFLLFLRQESGGYKMRKVVLESRRDFVKSFCFEKVFCITFRFLEIKVNCITFRFLDKYGLCRFRTAEENVLPFVFLFKHFMDFAVFASLALVPPASGVLNLLRSRMTFRETATAKHPN